MGRPEVPIDPSEGPLQAFAWDLRLLRTKVGQPSYRKLALKVNYSASTLSAAASGVTVPSLQVTLAYVTACDGDQIEWEQRWHDLQALLTTQRVAALALSTVDEDEPAPAARPRWRRPLATGTATLLVVTACDWLISMDDGPGQVFVVGLLAGLLAATGAALNAGRSRPTRGA